MRSWTLALPIAMLMAISACADTLELTNGSKLDGQLIQRDSQSITFSAEIGGKSYSRKYPLDKVLAVTVAGRRELIAKSDDTTGSAPKTGTALAAGAERSRAEVAQIIAQAGSTRPDWWDSVAVNYPRTLDLSWPDRPPPPWNNQRNIGQYVWDIINPNANRWREGVRFMDHLMSVYKDDPPHRNRAMRELARMYQDLLRDYPRAAFWWQQAGVPQDQDYAGVQLAECYWRLGNKEMANETLAKTPPAFSMIKLWADMGEVDLALEMADANAAGPAADIACIYAGDACRVAGRSQKALEYYQRVLAVPASGQAARRIQRNQQRAASNIEGVRLFDALDLARIPDGKYQGSSIGFEHPLQVAVTVKQGRIESVQVTAQQEKQPYNSLIETPAKIIAKQSVKGIDTTSRATITSEAVINATAKALASGMR